MLIGCSEEIDVNEMLAQAAKSGKTNVVEDMIERGANIDVRDKKYNATALMWAAHEGHIKALQILLNHGAEIEATKGNGQTALWYAAQQNRLESVKMLVAVGANINATTNEGVSVLGIAQERGYNEVAEYLKAEGAN